ncbi:MAG: hypothetical protein QW765_03065 [Fervidicoccaceae archaeon]
MGGGKRTLSSAAVATIAIIIVILAVIGIYLATREERLQPLRFLQQQLL